MAYARRLLEDGNVLLLQNGQARDLELYQVSSAYQSQAAAYVIFPKTEYAWIDRLGIVGVDIIGTTRLTGTSPQGWPISPSSTQNAGTLVIAADSTRADGVIGLAIVFWDERNNPIGVASQTIHLSGWATNSAGNFIPQNTGTSYAPGFLAIDISLAAGYTVLVQGPVLGGVPFNLHWKLV